MLHKKKVFFLNPGVVPQRVLPRGVIAPHRRWMPESNPTDNGSRYWGTRCSTTRSPVDARKQSTEMYLESRNHTASQHLCEGLGALLPRHGHPVLPVGRRPRTKLSGDFNSSSGVPPKSYTSVQPRGGGTRTGTARGDPPQGGVERPDTSRFGTFSTPTCCPESSPS